MSDATTAHPERTAPDPNGLGALLARCEVRRILFIDDGFDPIGDEEPTPQEQDDIWAAIQADTEGHAEATVRGIEQPEDVTGATINDIISGGDCALRRVVEATPYVVGYGAKTAIVAVAIDYLRTLGVEVLTAGKTDWHDKLEGVQIVFLDYRLGRDADEGAMLAASVAAREIHSRVSSKPYLVLVSSDPTVKDASERFSTASGLVGGMFDAMPKAWLGDQVRVDLNLSVILDLYKVGDAIQVFVEALRAEATNAVNKFISTIGRLTISDYANLQSLALQEDGHPLGNYLVELFSGFWADILYQGAVRDQLAVLDAKDFSAAPALRGPSGALTSLFSNASFDMHVGDIRPHPLDRHQDARRPQLSLGDMIIEREEGRAVRVYVVMNPQCDLAESPLGTRRIPFDRSIILVPGSIEPIDHDERLQRREMGDTPVFMIDGKAKRIHWTGRNLMSVPFGQFAEWMASGRERTARMRPLQALALQRQVSAELTRVGLPNPPPLHDAVSVSLVEARHGKWRGEPTASEQGRLVMARSADDDRILLTHSFVVDVAVMMSKGVSELSSQPPLKPKDKSDLDKVIAAMRDTRDWQKLATPLAVPEGGVKFFGGGLLVCRKAPQNGFDRKILACVVVDAAAPDRRSIEGERAPAANGTITGEVRPTEVDDQRNGAALTSAEQPAQTVN